MDTGIHIRASDQRHQPKKGRHRHDHYEILIIQSGGGKHWVDFEWFDVMPNQVYFMRPGQMHEFLPAKGCVFYFIAFDKNEIMLNQKTALNSFDFFQSFHCNGPVIVDEVDSLIHQMADIQYELDHVGPMQNMLLSGLLMVLLIRMQRKFCRFKKTVVVQDNDLVSAFNQYLDHPDFRYRFVKEYAKALHVSSTYLNDTVKRFTGFNARYWINKKQVILAKQLLNHRQLNFKSISTQLGFTDATHFARFFKAQTSLSPSMYRQALHAHD